MPVGLVAAGVGAVGAVAGGIISSNGAQSAARTNATEADKSLAAQQSNFDATTANNKPFLTTGTSALNQLARLYGLDTVDANGNTVKGSGTSQNIDPNSTFYQTPDYQFALNQGIKGIDAGAAARGGLDSGATRKAEMAYAGNLASGQFNTYASRLMQAAGLGQSAANSQANAGQANANAITGINTNVGAVNANAGLSSANSINSSIQSLVGAAQYGLGKNPFGSSYAGQIATASNGVTPQSPYGSANGAGVIY